MIGTQLASSSKAITCGGIAPPRDLLGELPQAQIRCSQPADGADEVPSPGSACARSPQGSVGREAGQPPRRSEGMGALGERDERIPPARQPGSGAWVTTPEYIDIL